MIARLRHIIDFFKESKNSSPNGSPSGYASNSQNESEGRTASPAGGYKTVPDSPILSRLSGVHGSRDALYRDTAGGFGVAGSGLSLERKTAHGRHKDDLDDSYNSATEGDYLSAVSDYNPRSRESSYFSASEGRAFSPLWMPNKNSHDTDICSPFTDSQATSPQMSSGFTSPTYRPFESPNYFSADETQSDSTIGHELAKSKNLFFPGDTQKKNSKKGEPMTLYSPEFEKPKIKLSKFFTEFKHIEPHVNVVSPTKTVRFEDEVMKDQPKIVKPSVSMTNVPANQNYELPKGPEATNGFEQTMSSSNGHSFIPFSVATWGENKTTPEDVPKSGESEVNNSVGQHGELSLGEPGNEKTISCDQNMQTESQPTSEAALKMEDQLSPGESQDVSSVTTQENLSLQPTPTVSEKQQETLVEQKVEVLKTTPETRATAEQPIIQESDELLADLESLIAFNDTLKRSLLLGEKPSINPQQVVPQKEKTDTADSPSEVKPKDVPKYDDEKVTLIIPEAYPKDSGVYVCTAKNLAGEAFSTCNVSVKGRLPNETSDSELASDMEPIKPSVQLPLKNVSIFEESIFPPVFGHRLQAQVAKRGERVLMDVEVTGTPEPTVTWYKDNRPLNEALQSEHRIKHEGNRHTLIIEKVTTRDSGKYMVKATNAGGEAQSIADFAVLEPTPERMVEVVKTVVYDDLKDFKEEKPKLSEAFHTKQSETSTTTDAHGTTESTVVTEHRCVTEATMKLEHKMPEIEFPLKTKSEMRTNKIEEISKLLDQFPIKMEPPKIPPSEPFKDTVPLKEMSQTVEKTSSIFEKKEVRSEPLFSGIKDSKLFDLDNLPKITPKLMQMEERKETETKSSFGTTSFEDFKLTPGSPPTMGYVPPPPPPERNVPQKPFLERKLPKELFTERKATQESLSEHKMPQQLFSERIRETEQTSKPLSAFAPVTSQREEYTKTFMKETKQFTSSSSPIFRPTAGSANLASPFDRSQSPRPSAEGIKMEKLWAAPKPLEPETTQKEYVHEMETKKYTVFSDSEPDAGVVEEQPRPLKEAKEIFEEKIKEHKEKQSSWAPELRAPSLVKQTVKKPEVPPKPTSDLIDLNLEPGPPPEILFAPAPATKTSHVETIEQTLHESLKKEPAKVVHGAVRTIPPFAPTIPPKEAEPVPPPVPTRPIILEKPAQICSTFSPPEVPPKPAAPTFHPPQFAPKPPEPAPTFQPVHYAPKMPEPETKPKAGYSSAATMVKNISMTTKQVKEQRSEPYPHTQEPKKVVPPPPSPAKYSRTEYRESDYGSDYESKIQPMWRPSSGMSDTEVKGYRPIRPVLAPSGRSSNLSSGTKSPVSNLSFEKPKFEPIRHEESSKVHTESHVSHVFKPKPVPARPLTSTPKQPATKPQSYTTQYYTAIAGPPLHHASMATETTKSMHMKESTESSQRVMNMSQTRRVIHFDQNKHSSHETPEPLEPFPYTVTSPVSHTPSPRPRIAVTPTPTKFVPGEFRDSDYGSELENARIRPMWSPNPYDHSDPQYRHVAPPRPSRSTSLPRSYERVMTPMEFDHAHPEMPSKIPINSPVSSQSNRSYKTQTIDRYSSRRSQQTMSTTKDDMNLQVGSPPKYGYFKEHAHHQVKDFGSTLRSKTNKFIQDISTDLKSPQIVRPEFKRAPSEGNSKPQAYREESRVSQYGTKHIDPDTGLIYFKYDFGYEFGILFPGEGKKFIGGGSHGSSKSLQNTITSSKFTQRTPNPGDIVIPVQHERTTSNYGGYGQKQYGCAPERDFPKYAYNGRKRNSLPGDVSIDELRRRACLYNQRAASEHYTTASTTQSNVPIPVNAQTREERPKRPPLFITPLKDIAVLIGQTARFECIVQCDPYPNITWAKNGYPLQNSNKHIIEFRNGVCRLTIPDAYPDDAAMYSCTGTNEIGSGTTTAELTVQGHRAPRH